MTFSESELADIVNTNYGIDENFVDDECFNDCYIYPLCPICSGADYLKHKTFKKRDRKRCRIQKIMAIFAADLHAKLIVKNSALYQESYGGDLYNTIEAIKKSSNCIFRNLQNFLRKYDVNCSGKARYIYK